MQRVAATHSGKTVTRRDWARRALPPKQAAVVVRKKVLMLPAPVETIETPGMTGIDRRECEAVYVTCGEDDLR